MKVKTQGNTTIIKNTEAEIDSFLEKVTEQHNLYKNTNLVLDVSQKKNLTNKDVLLFSEISKIHKKEKKSFVMVLDKGFDFNKATDKIMIVPTLQEAHDVIEMEEIERDLGF